MPPVKSLLKYLRTVALLLTLGGMETLLTYFIFQSVETLSYKMILWVGSNFLILSFLEILFQIYVKIRTGSFYQKIKKINFDEMFFEPHPFLTFVHKRNFTSHRKQKAQYPLHSKANYSYPPVKTNNLRHIDGPEGNRSIITPKPEGSIRILCLGASTTGNYLVENGTPYSYPLELEKYLQNRFPNQQISVHNCGQGGWTSAEILINFLLSLKDTDPDIVVLYHAYNDLPASLTPNFVSDYSHAKRNLGESYYKYRLASMIPMIPLGIYNFTVQTLFPFINPRNGILETVSKNKIDLKSDFKGMETYQRNLEYIVKLCLIDKIDVVLSTFAYFLHDEVKDSSIHLKYYEGVQLENKILKEIASTYHLPLVDNANLIPPDPKYFVDTIHFTPLGMRSIAENIGLETARQVEKRIHLVNMNRKNRQVVEA